MMMFRSKRFGLQLLRIIFFLSIVSTICMASFNNYEDDILGKWKEDGTNTIWEFSDDGILSCDEYVLKILFSNTKWHYEISSNDVLKITEIKSLVTKINNILDFSTYEACREEYMKITIFGNIMKLDKEGETITLIRSSVRLR